MPRYGARRFGNAMRRQSHTSAVSITATRARSPMLTRAKGSSLPAAAMRSRRSRRRPAPAAATAATGAANGEATSATASAGTSTPTTGIATRLVATAAVATVPNASALIGAVARVAPSDTAATWARP